MIGDITSWVSERIDADTDLDASVGLLVLVALENDSTLDEYLEQGDPAPVVDLAADQVEPVGAFLNSIRVEGFRGIGAPV